MGQRRLTVVEMVEKFQCPGCTAGKDTSCGKYQLDTQCGNTCANHCAGTSNLFTGRFFLGMPTGFNRLGKWYANSGNEFNGYVVMRLWEEGTHPSWNQFNIPVWKYWNDGFLYVRTYAPRTNGACVDVIQIEENEIEMIDEFFLYHPIDAGELMDQMDY